MGDVFCSICVPDLHPRSAGQIAIGYISGNHYGYEWTRAWRIFDR